MLIKEIKEGFAQMFEPGRYCLIVNVSNDGAEMLDEEIYNKCIHFPYILFVGNPLDQKKELGNIVKKIYKFDSTIDIGIYVNGLIKPNFNTPVRYFVNIVKKGVGMKFEERVNPKIIGWFKNMNSKFIFDAGNEDDIDDVIMIMKEAAIAKNRIWLTHKEMTTECLEQIFGWCRAYDFNFAINYGELFWND